MSWHSFHVSPSQRRMDAAAVAGGFDGDGESSMPVVFDSVTNKTMIHGSIHSASASFMPLLLVQQER